MGKLTFILGGARSGKSRFAEQLAARCQTVTYLATGQVTDAEMAERIARHRAGRPAHWRTVEEAFHPAAVIDRTGGGVILLDCVSFLVSNHLLRNEQACEENVLRELDALLALGPDVIAVSNEVGMGVVPEHRLGRLFRDVLGRVNQHLAARAEEAFVCWAGIPVEIKRLAAASHGTVASGGVASGGVAPGEGVGNGG